LFGLIFDPEDGGSMFIGNAGEPPPEYRALHPRKQHFSVAPLSLLLNNNYIF
jgi:hypothetical protein